MRRLIAAPLAAALAASPVAALAQDAHRPQQGPPAGQAVQQGTAQTDPSPADLGISLNRIRRELREVPPVKSNLLRYDFHVDVYGQNPKVDFFKDFDLSPNGSVRYGGMT